MLSDIRVGRLMASASVRGAIENVFINLESIADADFAAKMRAEAQLLLSRVAETPVTAVR